MILDRVISLFSTPRQRALREVRRLNKEIYEAEQALNDARYTLNYLHTRRTHLIAKYDFDRAAVQNLAPGSSIFAPTTIIGELNQIEKKA